LSNRLLNKKVDRRTLDTGHWTPDYGRRKPDAVPRHKLTWSGELKKHNKKNEKE